MRSRAISAILGGFIVVLAQFNQVRAADPPATVGKQIGTVEAEDAIVVTMVNPDPEGLPKDNGTWDGVNEFVFDDSQTGYCLIKCECTYMPDTATEQGLPWAEHHVKWSLTYNATTVEWGHWDGTTFWTLGEDEWGKEVWARISELPADNPADDEEGGLGNNTVTMDVDGVQVTAPIQIFFDRDAKNHPGDGSGTTANWYYYWGKFISPIASCTYKDDLVPPGECDYDKSYGGDSGEIYIGPEAVEPITISLTSHPEYWHKIKPNEQTGDWDINPILYLSGIDKAWRVGVHENAHHSNVMQDWGAWDDATLIYPAGHEKAGKNKLTEPFATVNEDGDWWSDAWEKADADGKRNYVRPPYQGVREFDHAHPMSLCIASGHVHQLEWHKEDNEIPCDEIEWTVDMGDNDTKDWASPGRQHSTNGLDD